MVKLTVENSWKTGHFPLDSVDFCSVILLFFSHCSVKDLILNKYQIAELRSRDEKANESQPNDKAIKSRVDGSLFL